jgi:Xaa-Pro aminopeptidase
MLHIRRARLERFFTAHDLDAILFFSLANIRYLSGFTGSDGALLLTREGCRLLCDSRYTTQAVAEVLDGQVLQYSDRNALLRELADDLWLSRIGFEAAHTSFAAFSELSSCLKGRELVSLATDLDQIRSCKDHNELERLSRVAGLASDALMACLGKLAPGVSEATFAWELEQEMRNRGAEGRAFDFIVASGERGAMPHGRASEKLIRSGELVTIDFGACMDGYVSDETVTIAIGTPDRRGADVYAVVKEAHDLAIAAVRPGISCRDLDAVARDHIRDRGFGDYFGHGLGHGVGLEVHEKPTISPRSDMTLQEGMVFTIEPGIYIPGFGGVRIEDTVVVQSDGCRALTRVSKELLHV